MRVERQIKISTHHGDVMMDFLESGADSAVRNWQSKYYLWISGESLMTTRVLALITAWIEHDDANFTHPQLTVTEDY